MLRRHGCLTSALLAVAVLAPSARAAPIGSPVALARACVTIEPSGAASGARPARFFLQPTTLRTYLLLDPDGRLLRRGAGGAVTRAASVDAAVTADEWRITPGPARTFAIGPPADGRRLVATSATGFALARSGPRFVISRSTGCLAFPEAQVGATGSSPAGMNPDGTVVGWADDHLHITADGRAGGSVISGKPFHRFGIPRALGRDADVHGADGALDVTGNLLRDGVPFGTHDTRGWPSFTGWPVANTNTHEQSYWVWLERAWKAGMRLTVAQTIEDDQLCRLEPRRAHSCEEPEAIALQVSELRAMQDYVDAQAGGKGRGFFRLVSDPKAARRVIARGRLAVVIGVESSNPFGCRIRDLRPVCTNADVDRGLASYRRKGIRSLFVTHWFDNSFAGAALEGGTKGKLINAMNRLETGRYFATGTCPRAGQGEAAVAPARFEIDVLKAFFPAVAPLLDAPVPDYAKGPACNTRGLTPVGEHLVRRMMDTHMIIEVDHLSERARDRVLDIAQARHYPLVSSHNGTGGPWTAKELQRLYAGGGYAAATPAQAPEAIAKIRRLASLHRDNGLVGVGFGSDVGGFSSLPAAREDAAGPLPYPFTSHDGRVSFARERSGTRTFDLNVDGVAHYGLFADLVADMQRRPHGDAATRLLFRSAEAYLRAWERTGA